MRKSDTSAKPHPRTASHQIRDPVIEYRAKPFDCIGLRSMQLGSNIRRHWEQIDGLELATELVSKHVKCVALLRIQWQLDYRTTLLSDHVIPRRI